MAMSGKLAKTMAKQLGQDLFSQQACYKLLAQQIDQPRLSLPTTLYKLLA